MNKRRQSTNHFNGIFIYNLYIPEFKILTLRTEHYEQYDNLKDLEWHIDSFKVVERLYCQWPTVKQSNWQGHNKTVMVPL